MASGKRYAWVDAARGIAILMMFSFHFCFDLTFFGFAHWDFYRDPFWLHYRTVIVSSFLFIVGVSLALAHARTLNTRAFLRRLAVLIGCAALVSLGSYLFFRERFIFFGILHFIAVASILGVLMVRHYWLNLILGVSLILIGTQFQSTLFNHPALQWFGLMTYKPATEDYVPLLPWFGVVTLGIFFAQHLRRGNRLTWLQTWPGLGLPAGGIRFLGRHSLLIYMLHQPVFIGVLYAIKQLSG